VETFWSFVVVGVVSGSGDDGRCRCEDGSAAAGPGRRGPAALGLSGPALLVADHKRNTLTFSK
jgi:hypothetical protein